MDPLTAIGLASNIVSFIDFGIKVISVAKDIYDSNGSPEKARSIELLVGHIKDVSSKIRIPAGANVNGNERALCGLASECDSLADQILRLVKKMKPRDAKSKSSSLAAAFKTKWYEGDLRKLEERLGSCRDQLGLQLNYIASAENKARLDSLVISSKDNSDKLENLYHQIHTLQRDVTTSSLSPGAQKQLSVLLEMSERVGNAIIRSRIIEALAFDDMYGRYESVDNAHFKTFRWIFGETSNSDSSGDFESDCEPDNGPEPDIPVRQEAPLDSSSRTRARHMTASLDPEDQDHDSMSASKNSSLSDVNSHTSSRADSVKVTAREALVAWLSQGRGIFHISGKLGSGKSTLMKFLCEHSETENLLKEWAGARALVFAKFFFWRQGSKLQRSLTGLFRSLLHDVLEAYPDVIPDVLPDCWRRLKSTPWQALREVHIPDKDIRSAFSSIIADSRLYKNHCFCFFIDGLDEYEGTNQDDARFLVDVLCNWTAISPNNIKLCVSSREYNLFMNAFSPDLRMRLHELTRGDMTRYVADKLGRMETKERSTLIASIVNRSDGIFLWVALVVKRLREQVENGSSFDELRAKIDQLPRELDGLFGLILDSLADADLKRAYQTFSIVMALQNQNLHLTLYQYSFLDDYNRDPLFATNLDPGKDHVNPDEKAQRINTARKRLIGCCKGLVEPGYSTGDDLSEVIIFTHRSVPEFLVTKMREEPQHLLGDFSPADAMSQLVLAGGATDAVRPLADTFEAIVKWRTYLSLDRAPYIFLESLSRIISTGKEISADNSVSEDNTKPSRDLEVNVSGSLIGSCPSHKSLQNAKADDPLDPVYSAAFFGNWDYVRWKLSHNSTAACPFSKEILLTCLIRGSLHKDTSDETQEIVDTVDFLIAQGLAPDFVTDISYYPMCEYAEDVQPSETKRVPIFLSVWHHLLFNAYIFHSYTIDEEDTLSSEPQLRNMGYVLERYLAHGVDLQPFRFSARKFDDDKVAEDHQDWRFDFVLGREERSVSVKLLRHDFAMMQMEAASIEEFLAQLDLNNKDRLLKLVRTGYGKLKRSGHIKSAVEYDEGGIGEGLALGQESQSGNKEGEQASVFQALKVALKALYIVR